MTGEAVDAAAVERLLAEHVRVSTAGMAGESRPGFWMCKCRAHDHAPAGERFAYDRDAHHSAHVAEALAAALAPLLTRPDELSEDERRSIGCDCWRLGDVWQHKRGCMAPQVEAILSRRQAQPDEAVRAAVEAVLGTCRCTLQYPGFDRTPFTSSANCWAHGTHFLSLRKALDAALAQRERAADGSGSL